jgi:hypothetical protein
MVARLPEMLIVSRGKVSGALSVAVVRRRKVERRYRKSCQLEGTSVIP